MAVNSFRAAVRVLFMAAVCATSIGAADASGEPKKNGMPSPIEQHLQAINDAWPKQGDVLKGKVKFVAGNDLWQPGRQFQNGGNWLALACTVDACTLESAVLSVNEESWQGHYDSEPTKGQHLRFETTGKTSSTVVAWFRQEEGLTWLKPGAVATYYTPVGPPAQRTKRTLEAVVSQPGGASATLVPMWLTRESASRYAPDNSGGMFLLQLRMKNRRQLLSGQLGTCSGMIDPRQYLQWAGDLDRDGETDFLISFIDAEGPVHLYLSGLAEGGQLVGLAGVYMSPPFGGECDGGEF